MRGINDLVKSLVAEEYKFGSEEPFLLCLLSNGICVMFGIETGSYDPILSCRSPNFDLGSRSVLNVEADSKY